MGIKIRNNRNKEVIEETIETIEEELINDNFLPEEQTDFDRSPSIKEVFNITVNDLEDHKVTRADIENQTDKMLEKVSQTAIKHTITNGEKIQKDILNSAEDEIRASLEVKKSKNQLKVVRASYDANKDACENLGLDSEGRPMWQIRVAKIINDFWFIVWALISAVTLTPIIFILKRVGTQVKSAKLTWILTFSFYLLIMFLMFMIIIAIWNSTGTPPDWIQKFLGGK